jgi:hypothetical protein
VIALDQNFVFKLEFQTALLGTRCLQGTDGIVRPDDVISGLLKDHAEICENQTGV